MPSSPIQDTNNVILDAVSTGTDQTTSSISIRNIKGYAVQHVWTAGTGRTGEIDVSGSNQENGIYTCVDSYTIDTNSGDRLLNVETANYSYIKVTFTNTAGTGGTLTSILSTKLY